MRRVASIVMVSILMCIGCGSSSEQRRAQMAAIAELYVPPRVPYEPQSEDGLAKWQEAVNSLKYGDSAASVLERVGAPNDFTIGIPKEPYAPPAASFWDYYLTKPSSRPLTTHDEYVTLVFDRYNHLIAVHSMRRGVPGWRGSK